MTALLRSLARVGPPIVFSTFAVAGTLAWSSAHAQGSSSTAYLISPPSAYNMGCYGPCDCAVRGAPMDGTFRLRFVSTDPLYTNYAVEDFRGTVHTESGLAELRGSGEYRIGGEVALTQQLRLALQSTTGVSQTFDSGVVPVTTTFPAISVSVAANGFACYDTVIDVVAKPLAAGVPGPHGSPLDLHAVPNPSGGETQIVFALPAASRVDVSIVDTQGREVASLARARVFSAGGNALLWDGRDAGGTRARAGLYLVVVRVPGATVTHRLVRLE